MNRQQSDEDYKSRIQELLKTMLEVVTEDRKDQKVVTEDRQEKEKDYNNAAYARYIKNGGKPENFVPQEPFSYLPSSRIEELLKPVLKDRKDRKVVTDHNHNKSWKQ